MSVKIHATLIPYEGYDYGNLNKVHCNMIPSTLAAAKISLLVIATLFNKWSSIYRRYKCGLCVWYRLNNTCRTCNREHGLRQWQPLYIDVSRCPKANLALLNNFFSNETNSRFHWPFPQWYCYKSPLHILAGLRIKTIYSSYAEPTIRDQRECPRKMER